MNSVLGVRPGVEPAAPPLPASLATRYRVERKIGQGGMGVVFVAQDLKLSRPVVLKQLLYAEPEHVARLAREGQVLATLNHPRILKLYGVEVVEGIPVLVLELLEGVTLRAQLEAMGPLAPARALAVADMVADALVPVHAAGLVHRDLKPDNILLTPDGGLKVLDFGLARLAERGANDAALTQPGIYVGTPPYMAPELWRGEPLDGRTDLYALGVIMFETLTGQLPFDASNVTALAVKHLTDPPPDLFKIAPAVARSVGVLVERLLAKSRDDRPRDAATLRAELAACAAPESAPRTAVTRRPSRREPVARPASKPDRDGLSRPASAPEHALAAGAGPDAPPSTAPTPSRKGTGKSPVRPQDVKRWALVHVLLPAIAIGLGLGLALRAYHAPRDVAAEVALSDLVVNAPGSQTVTFTFHTAQPTRWTASSSAGASVTEAGEGRMHALTLPVMPWEMPDRLELSCGSKRIAVTPPAGPRARIRRLLAATRAARLDLRTTDQVYDAIRKTFRGWNTMDPVSSNAARAAKELADLPELADPLMKLIASAREPIEALAPVRGLVTEALTTADTPVAVQEELLEALTRLDHLDALAGFFGYAPPAGVQKLLAPVFDVQVRKLAAPLAKSELAAGACTLYQPSASDGFAIFLPQEDVTRAGDGFAQLMALQKIPGLQNVDAGSQLDLLPCVKPGPRGYKLVVRLRSFPTGIYLWLGTGRGALALPLRLEPAQDAGVLAEIELTARIPAALFTPGATWRLAQRRLFLTASRTYYVVRRAELLPD